MEDMKKIKTVDKQADITPADHSIVWPVQVYVALEQHLHT